MNRLLIAVLCLLSAVCVGAQTLEQTAGIYYAYPGPQGTLTAVPEGYEPFYISHYGRHGSRWITDDYRYTTVLALFDSVANLTPLGQDVRSRLQRVTADALGRSGSLSPVGERQHRGIAQRMIGEYPQVFADSSRVRAVSSTSLRCAMSMMAFVEALKEVNPRLTIDRSAHQRDMDYIAHVTDEGKAFSGNDGPWRPDYWRFVYEMVRPERLVSSLFIDPSALTDRQQFDLATGLYWIASDMQDVELDETFYDIFTYDELRDMWRCINARMYVCNGNSPVGAPVMKHCADNLLQDIIVCADSAIANGDYAANLRFGHDTHLLRLLTLIGLGGAEETDYHKMHEAWQDYALSPMAANLQFVFFRNPDGDVIVKVLVNENEVTLPLSTDIAPYYRWSDLRAYMLAALASD